MNVRTKRWTRWRNLGSICSVFLIPICPVSLDCGYPHVVHLCPPPPLPTTVFELLLPLFFSLRQFDEKLLFFDNLSFFLPISVPKI